ncbi:O-antigen ligase family protein [Desulfonatronum thiosulfatophilum]|nr:O-antigen ligase family protein [Desulfonatronum thiosulfatophilum]
MTDNLRIHRNVYYLLVLPLFFLQVPVSFFYSLFRSPVFLASLAFLGYLWVSFFWSTASGALNFYNETRSLILMLIFLAIIAFYSLVVDNFSRLLAKCLACVVGITALVSVYAFYISNQIPITEWLTHRAWDIGITARHIGHSSGLYGAVAVFLIFGLVTCGRQGKIRKSEGGRQEGKGESPDMWMWIGAVALVPVLGFVFLTQTRGALLGIVTVLGLGVLAQGDRRLFLMSAVSAGALLAVVAMRSSMSDARLEIWSLALDRAWERPWFGFGLNEIQGLVVASGYNHDTAHNMFLDCLQYGGLVGLLLLLGLIVLALRGAWREYRRTGSFLLFAIVLYPLIFGFFDSFLTLSRVSPMWFQFWLPVGLVIGSEIRARREEHAGKI